MADEPSVEELEARIAETRALVEARRAENAAQQGADGSQLTALQQRAREVAAAVAQLRRDAEDAEQKMADFERTQQEQDAQLQQRVQDTKVPVEDQVGRAEASRDAVIPQTDPTLPHAVLDEQHAIVKEREREIVTVEKQLRELDMTLQQKRQSEADIAAEAQKQIDETRREKDEQIHTLVLRCMKERETVLNDIRDSKRQNEEANERMRNGYLEDHDAKGRHLKELADMGEAGVLVAQGNEERGQGGPPREISLRCAKPRTEEDDMYTKFQKRKTKQKEHYGDLETQVKAAKEERRQNREQTQQIIRTTKELQDRITGERAEREREVKRLNERVATEKAKQQHYELENQKLFLHLKNSERELKTLEGNIGKSMTATQEIRKQNEELISLTAPERPKAITGPRR